MCTLEYFEKAVKSENFPYCSLHSSESEFGPVVFDIREMIATFFSLWRSLCQQSGDGVGTIT